MLKSFIELIAPPRCVGCGNEGDVLCTTCQAGLPDMKPVCYACGRESAAGITCSRCALHSRVDGISLGASYDGAVRALLLEFKFRRSRAAARVAARLLATPLAGAPAVDAVTAIPISPARYRERGYNQAELVAKAVARSLSVPYRRLLGRENAQHQIGRGRSARLAAIEGSFFAVGQLKGERLLLVDDVVTTGATLDEAAKVLRAAGAVSVWAAAVARRGLE